MRLTKSSGILRYNLISTGQPDLIIVNKKKKKKKRKKKKKKERNCRILDFAVSVNYRVKLKESEKKDKYLDLARETKNKQTVERESDGDTNCNWYSWYS